MNVDPQALEQIVAEVVRRLSQLAATPSAAVPASEPVGLAKTAPVRPKPSSDTLVVDARVISTATIHNRLKGIRTVVVGPRAIVTPSVRDELDKRHIRLEREPMDGTPACAGSLTVVRCPRAADAARADSTLPLPADAAEHHRPDLAAAVAEATGSVSDASQVAVIVTDLVVAATCLLNRTPHVRAAQVRTVEETRHAIAAIGANVLVIDPRDTTANRWSAIVKEFCKDLPRNCPVGWSV